MTQHAFTLTICAALALAGLAPAAAASATAGFGWLAELSGSCWKQQMPATGRQPMEVCFWLDTQVQLLRVQRLDAEADGSETTLAPMPGQRAVLEERRYDAACRMRPNVLRYEDGDPTAEVFAYDDMEQSDQLVGMVRHGWRRIDAERFERSVLLQPFGGAGRSGSWTFVRSRGYHVVGASRCASSDRTPFPPELRGQAAAH